MLRIFFQLRFIAGIVMFVGSYWGWQLVRVETTDHERTQNKLANELAKQAVNDLPFDGNTVSVSVARLANDEDDVVNGMLRHWLHRHGHHVTKLTAIVQLKQFLVNYRDARTAADAGQLARNEGVQYVAFGEVQRLCTIPNRSCLSVRLRLYDSSQRKIVADASYCVPSDLQASTVIPDRADKDGRFKDLGIVAAVWLLVVCILPMAVTRPIARVLRRGSNRYNAIMLLAYVIVVVSSAQLLWTGLIDHWIALPLLLIVTLFAAAYFAFLCRSLDNYRA